MNDRLKGDRPDVPREVGRYDDGLTQDHLAEFDRRAGIGFDAVLRIPCLDRRDAMQELIAELEEFLEQCRREACGCHITTRDERIWNPQCGRHQHA